MTIVDRLRPGDLRTKGASEATVRLVLARPALLGELMAGLPHPEPGVRMRAADALEKVSGEKPELLKGRARALLGLAAQTDQREVQWHVAQMLPRLPLSAAGRRRAWQLLSAWLASGSRIVRAFSLEGLTQLSRDDPELRAKAVTLLQRALHDWAPAVRARARKLRREMERTIAYVDSCSSGRARYPQRAGISRIAHSAN